MRHYKVFLFIPMALMLGSCTNISLLIVNSLAKLDDYSVIRNIPYAHHDLTQLDIYIPEKKQELEGTIKHPVVIFFYGGCWGGCETRNKEHYEFVAQAFTAKGFIVVLADYRRYPEVVFDSIIDDASHSVKWVKEHIVEYGGDNNRLFLMGHSAGAHLAAMLTLNEALLKPEVYRSIKGFVGLAGPYDFLPFTDAYQFDVFGPEEKYFESQPINFVDGSEPPLLLLYGNEDVTVFPRNIKNLAEKVNNKQGKVQVHIYPEIDHFSILGALSLPYQNNRPILADIIRFLNEHSGMPTNG